MITAGPNLPRRRREHTATRLRDGRVLFVGGAQGQSPVQFTSLWEADAWVELASPRQARFEHAAILLGDGRVLIAGGRAFPLTKRRGLGLARLAEIFDPTTGAWSDAGETATDRASPRMMLAGDDVLLVGGADDPPLVERWRNGAWSPAPPTAHQRYFLDVAGTLVVGGAPDPELERWDATTGTWHAAGRLATARESATATALGDGRVLIVGGTGGGKTLASCELWERDGVKPTGALAGPRCAHSATLLADGRVLVTGGMSNPFPAAFLASCEVWDPATQRWSDAGTLADARVGHTATLLDDGRVLIVGGNAGGPSLASVELWGEADKRPKPKAKSKSAKARR